MVHSDQNLSIREELSENVNESVEFQVLDDSDIEMDQTVVNNRDDTLVDQDDSIASHEKTANKKN